MINLYHHPSRELLAGQKKQRRKDANEGSIQNNRLKRSYPECICTRCGHPNHNIRNYINFGVPPKPRGWKPVEAIEVPASPTNPTATTKNENEPQIEIDASQSQPTTQPSQPQNANTFQEPMGQGKPNINFRNPPYRPPRPISAARANYRGQVGTPGPTSTAGPFQGASASSGPISAARPFQGRTSSSPTTARSSETSGPTFAAGPFQGASAATANKFMQFIPTPGICPPPPKKH
ncbi:hypothetical protein SESBI_05856 [Sesbania bispinosa]|nr:hypothetical protein SESBI_05856 [Sesbania bispinosa]